MVPLSILLDYEGHLLLNEIYDSMQPSTPQSYRLSTSWHPEQGRTEYLYKGEKQGDYLLIVDGFIPSLSDVLLEDRIILRSENLLCNAPPGIVLHLTPSNLDNYRRIRNYVENDTITREGNPEILDAPPRQVDSCDGLITTLPP
jgi:hypothetical protein